MYKLIYSIKGDSCGGIFALLGLVPAVIGVVILFARPHWSVLRARGIWYPAAMIVGGCAWSLAGLLFFLNCADLRAALSAGRTEVLEGIVQQIRGDNQGSGIHRRRPIIFGVALQDRTGIQAPQARW